MLLNDKIKKKQKKNTITIKKHVYKCGYNDYPHLLEFC
jgi:hypothetical protein